MWNATSSKIRNPIAVWNNTVFSYFGVATGQGNVPCICNSGYPCSDGCAAVYWLDLVTNKSSEIIIGPHHGELRLARRIVASTENRCHARPVATNSCKDKLFFLGGRDWYQATVGVNRHVDTVYQYELNVSNGQLSGGTWSQVASGGKPIWESTAATVVGDKFLFFGGQFGGSDIAPFEVGLHAFDLSKPVYQSYTPVVWYSRGANDNDGVSGAAPSPREDPAMTAMSGQVFLVHGGYTYGIPDCPCGSALVVSDCVSTENPGTLLSDFWMFDTQVNNWFSLPASTTPKYGLAVAPEPRTQHGMVSIGDNAFLFGGRTSGQSSSGIDQTDSLYSFNMNTR